MNVSIGPSLAVLIHGVPASETTIGNGTYVSAPVGTEYALRISNPYPRRIGVELSVDGLNTIDAKETSGKLWILAPGETAEIPGWQVSGATARKFVISEQADSYSRKLGRATETGVIRARFVEELVRGVTWTTTGTGWPSNYVYCNAGGSTMDAVPYTLTSAVNLGTAQGERTAHAVSEVTFSRGSDIGTVEIRYVTPAVLATVLDVKHYAVAAESNFCPDMRAMGK